MESRDHRCGLDLAFGNGANDNMKGIATVHGSGEFGHRAALTLGTKTASAHLEILAPGNSTPLFQQSWPDTLGVAGIDALVDGRSYTLVLVGAQPGFLAGRWWNGAGLTLVDNDPTR